ncbi:Biotin carboxyl carrier protein of acetyl-CoA [Musa troglodytarum]|uniref:Biotin carboxyl carrier protein of acetyl-CoA n=1 Tax=Musa troglodytarum TaxID=320322 RepID=A0A9E7H7U1_9LILI|nr:Biotin carboxyl carrier protein of acetyl-CoA [Musa troglodytarum]
MDQFGTTSLKFNLVHPTANSAPRTMFHGHSSVEKPVPILVSSAVSKSLLQRVPEECQRSISSKVLPKHSLHVKASQNTSTLTTNVFVPLNAADTNQKNSITSTFPNGCQTLIEEVCDLTDIAELKMKVGDFEMFLKRDVGISNAYSVSAPMESPITAPPIPSKPMVEAVPSSPPVLEQKSTATAAKTSKLAALEATGQNAYALVSSSSVGSFQRGRTLKGERQPPICKEGDIIKEGQIIGFLDQFGNELPVRSDVAGEVIKILCENGEAVGYGDPLVAVLPSFHGVK